MSEHPQRMSHANGAGSGGPVSERAGGPGVVKPLGRK